MLTWNRGYRHKRFSYVPILFLLLPVCFLNCHMTVANYAGRHYGARGMLLRSTINAELTFKERASNKLWGRGLPAVSGLVDDEELKIRRNPSYPALRNTSAPFLLGQGGEEGGRTQPHGEEETAGEWLTVGGYNITLPKRSRARTTLSDPYSVPLFVMLPLDTVTWNHTINHKDRLNFQLKSLKAVGVTGVMVDVWWGLCERDAPGHYVWDGYISLARMCENIGLKMQAVMSFHQCGGNVGDTCLIPLPVWVLELGESMPDIFFRDAQGVLNKEVLSLGVDELSVWPSAIPGKNRTVIDMYTDFMQKFADVLRPFLGSTIVEAQVGLGPAGELRYPSYPSGRWHYPGIGQFQCFDKHMLASLKAAAEAEEAPPEWGVPPSCAEVGSYNCKPWEASFFMEHGGGWESARGTFFMNWYSGELLKHGERVIKGAVKVFNDTDVIVAGKVAGIHWWYYFASHPAELTAGYFNTKQGSGYADIAAMLARNGAVFDFTCLEMRDGEAEEGIRCAPATLVGQVRETVWSQNCKFAGENALPLFGQGRRPYEQILWQTVLQDRFRLVSDSADRGQICGFTLLRLHDTLFLEHNLVHFRRFSQELSLGIMLPESEPLLDEHVPPDEVLKKPGAEGVVARLRWALHRGIAVDTELTLPGGGGSVRAHAAVLAAQSPYFAEILVSKGERNASEAAWAAAQRLQGLRKLELDAYDAIEGHRSRARAWLRRAQADAEHAVMAATWRGTAVVKSLIITLRQIRQAEGMLEGEAASEEGGARRLDGFLRCALALVDEKDHRMTDRKLLKSQLRRVHKAHMKAEKSLSKLRQDTEKTSLRHEQDLRASEKKLLESERRRVEHLAEIRGVHRGIASRLDALEAEEIERRNSVQAGLQQELDWMADDDEEDDEDDEDSASEESEEPEPPSEKTGPDPCLGFRSGASLSAAPPVSVAAAGGKPVFKVKASTHFGQMLMVVGDWEGFGAWDIKRGLEIHTSVDKYPEWSARPIIDMPEGVYEYKFVKVDGLGKAEWETGPNRVVRVTPDGVPNAGEVRLENLAQVIEVVPADSTIVAEGNPAHDMPSGNQVLEVGGGIVKGMEMPACNETLVLERAASSAVEMKENEGHLVLDMRENGDGKRESWVAIRDSMLEFEARLKELMQYNSSESKDVKEESLGIHVEGEGREGGHEVIEEQEEEAAGMVSCASQDDEDVGGAGEGAGVCGGDLVSASQNLTRAMTDFAMTMEEVTSLQHASQGELLRAREKAEKEVASLMLAARGTGDQEVERRYKLGGTQRVHLYDSSMQMFSLALDAMYTGNLKTSINHCREALEGVQRFCVPSCALTVANGEISLALSLGAEGKVLPPSTDEAVASLDDTSRPIFLQKSGVGLVGGAQGVVQRLKELWMGGLLTDMILTAPDDASCPEEEVRAHACILSASSTVFRRLIIAYKGRQSISGDGIVRLKIKRCGFATLLKAIQHCYSGSLEEVSDKQLTGEVAELWVLSVRLGLFPLQIACASVLTSCMSRELASED